MESVDLVDRVPQSYLEQFHVQITMDLEILTHVKVRAITTELLGKPDA